MKIPLACLLIALAAPVNPQIVLNPPRNASVFHVDVDLVNVLCAVRDRHGAFVKDLTQSQFEIKEDGKLQTITHFAPQVDSPMTVAMLLDVSGSVRSVLGEEKDAATRFFNEVMRPGDRALFVGFANVIAVWEELTESKSDLVESIGRAGTGALPSQDPEFAAQGGTLLYDAVDLVALQKLRRLHGRKGMILITDGEDNGSSESLSAAAKSAQQSDAVVYRIHYGGRRCGRCTQSSGLDALVKLAEPTGGRAFHVDEKMPLSRVFAEIAEEMRNQYGLGYSPPNSPPGSCHKLEVKVTKAGGKPQVRAGYYSAGQ
jgi:Ca-activated chloride channel family protein